MNVVSLFPLTRLTRTAEYYSIIIHTYSDQIIFFTSSITHCHHVPVLDLCATLTFLQRMKSFIIEFCFNYLPFQNLKAICRFTKGRQGSYS